MATSSWNALTSISSLVAIEIKGLMIWGSKCHRNNFPVVCDSYVKYEEAEVDRLVVILKTNNCGGGGGGGGPVWNTVSNPPRRGLLNKAYRHQNAMLLNTVPQSRSGMECNAEAYVIMWIEWPIEINCNIWNTMEIHRNVLICNMYCKKVLK